MSNLDYRFLTKEAVQRILSKLEIEEIDSSLFSSLKQRLFCQVTVDNSNIQSNRYLEQPSIISYEELIKVFKEVENFFKSKENLVSKLKKHFSELEKLPKKRYIPFSITSQEGILFALSGKVKVISSSIYNDRQPESVLDWTDSYWAPKTEPNQWLTFHFPKQISICGYHIKFQDRHYVLRKWQIQGSVDNSTWITIDERTDSSIPDPQFDAAFQFNFSFPFSFVRFLPTGTTIQWNDWDIRINSFEFFGSIYE